MFKRVHDTGTETLLSQHQDGWCVHINLREPNHNPITITGYITPTVELAKKLADEETLKYGHVCHGSCKGWLEF